MIWKRQHFRSWICGSEISDYYALCVCTEFGICPIRSCTSYNQWCGLGNFLMLCFSVEIFHTIYINIYPSLPWAVVLQSIMLDRLNIGHELLQVTFLRRQERTNPSAQLPMRELKNNIWQHFYVHSAVGFRLSLD